MGSEVTGAIAGLVGAAFGAGAAMWGSLTAARTQLRLNQAQLQAAVAAEESRIARGAYADFLRAGIQFELAWRTLLISFREGSNADERDRLYARVIEFEHNRWMFYSVVLLEAPEPVVTLARELTAAYVELDTIGETARRRLAAEKDGSTARWPEFDQASSKCGELTAKFAEGVKAARAAARGIEVVESSRRARRSRSSGPSLEGRAEQQS
jgi:hypothetical protein